MQRLRKQYHTRSVGMERHTWDVHRLIRLSKELPVTSIRLPDIAETRELWWYQDADDIPTPQSILDHMRLVDEADLQWPIILCSEGRLMDGMHRVVKALREGHHNIAAIIFPETPAPDFINADVARLPYSDEDI